MTEKILFCVLQGSTPTLELVLPLDLAEEDVVYATFAQDFDPVLEYQRNGTPTDDPPEGDIELARDDPRLLLLHMTQADTLRLEAGDVTLQLRVKTAAGADTLLPIFGRVIRADKGGEI